MRIEAHGDDPARRSPREAFVSAQTYAATRLPVDLASTLIPDAYTSAEFYELEQQRVFGRLLGGRRDDLRARASPATSSSSRSPAAR